MSATIRLGSMQASGFFPTGMVIPECPVGEPNRALIIDYGSCTVPHQQQRAIVNTSTLPR